MEKNMKNDKNATILREEKSYIAPTAVVFRLSAADVLTASTPTLNPGGTELPYRPLGGLLGDDDSDLLSR